MVVIWPRSNIKLILLSIERSQIHDFDVDLRVLRYTRHSSVARKNLEIALRSNPRLLLLHFILFIDRIEAVFFICFLRVFYACPTKC